MASNRVLRTLFASLCFYYIFWFLFSFYLPLLLYSLLSTLFCFKIYSDLLQYSTEINKRKPTNYPTILNGTKVNQVAVK